MEITAIDGTVFARMIRCGSENLRLHKTVVNELNVFPVPDGDTGDNMYMTCQAGCDEIKSEVSVLDRASADAAHGMLLGARGNSGVILSRIFSGIADALDGRETSDVRLMCRAFESGVKKAYGAVSVPVEGTILTVFREAAEYVCENSEKYTTLNELFDDFLIRIRLSLKRTPELLEVLKNAGVVDSGGAGFYYIVEGMKKALDDWDAEAVISNDKTVARAEAAAQTLLLPDCKEHSFGYCTEFLLQLMSSKTDTESFDINELIGYLEAAGGDSIVAFREGVTVKVHVHTKNPGKIIEHCQRYGEYLKLKIENMALQSENTIIRNGFTFDEEDEEPTLRVEKPRKRLAVVAVACGEGIKKVLLDGGADAVVDGGQSMNPSAKAFINAFDEVNADTVIVLPDNGNIILTAKQAAELYDGSDIRIIESRSLGEGCAALSMLDPEAADVDHLIGQMRDASQGVLTAMVSRAVRDSSDTEMPFVRGDYIGFIGDRIYSADCDPVASALSLASRTGAADHDVIIVFYGKSIQEDDADRLCAGLEDLCPRTEVAVIDGGQSIYDFIMVFE